MGGRLVTLEQMAWPYLAFRIPFVGRITAVVDTIEVGTEGYDHEVDMADDVSGDSCWDHH